MLSKLERLLAELKRRHVFRMAGLYAVGAWLVIQVADTTFPYLGIPQWTITALIIIAGIGLPVTIALAWAFDLTAEGIRRDAGDDAAAMPRARATRFAIPLAVTVAIVLLGFVIARRVVNAGAKTLDANLAAVVPFRVSGGDARTAELSEGMVDLLAMRLSGDQGMRAADARGTISAWRRAGGEEAADPLEAATSAARAVGAGRVITGSVVVTGDRVSIGAALNAVGDRGQPPRNGKVTGSLDSLLYLVDNLALELLARDAGLESQRLGGLTSVSALQSYLAGKAAHRRGNYAEAIRDYQAALEADSTFALAAIALSISARRTPQQFSLFAPAINQAYRHRSRLGARDQALLHALAPTYPRYSALVMYIEAFEQMLAKWPDDGDAWFELGDMLMHYGAAGDIPNSLDKAKQAFDRALAIDSTFYLPLEHRLMIAFEENDGEQVLAIAPRLHRVGANADRFDYLRWRIALALGDSAGVNAAAARIDSMTTLSLDLILGEAQWQGARLGDAERVVAVFHRRAATDADRREALRREHDLALNRGRIRHARTVLDRFPVDAQNPTARDLAYLRDALFWDGDTIAANEAAQRLTRVANAASPTTADAIAVRAQLQCDLAWWDLARARVDLATTRMEHLRKSEPNAEAFIGDDRDYCVSLITAWIAVSQKTVDARTLLQRADSININSATNYWQYGNLITARLRERMGDPAGALVSIRRILVGAADIQQRFVSTYLRETARLAVTQNDTALARDHYRRYLALRTNPDSTLQPDVARARAALARMTAEQRP
jgi:eukaryotic-like serine/threonine-protein kinase